MAKFQTVFDGSDDNWEFTRRSESAVLDKDGVERQVPVNARGILGGEWDGDQFVGGGEFIGLDLRDETTDEGLNLAVTQSGDSLAQHYGTLGLRMTRGGFSGQIQYVFDGYPDTYTTFFALTAGVGHIMQIGVFPNGDIAVRFEELVTIITPSAQLDCDIRVRYSAESSVTVWVNGLRTDQLDPPMLRAAPERFIVGYSDHTSGLGALRHVQFDDQPRPFSMIEGWERV